MDARPHMVTEGNPSNEGWVRQKFDMPPRIARLPRDAQGRPVPWFVQWFRKHRAWPAREDENQMMFGAEPCEAWEPYAYPDFRVIRSDRMARAVKARRCWTCGGHLGRHLAFLIGPMCAINRTIAEPPSHLECAEFSAKTCPFLSFPNRKRRAEGLPGVPPAGMHLDRNPGVVCIWVTDRYKPFSPGRGGAGVLFALGAPTSVQWICRGRPATRFEVLESIAGGLPVVYALAKQEGEQALLALRAQTLQALRLLPDNEYIPPSNDEATADWLMNFCAKAKPAEVVPIAEVRAALEDLPA